MALSFYRKITIDHTKCGASDSSNFPLLFYGTYAGSKSDPDLRSVGNGGQVQNSNGYDIQFYSDAGLTTRIAAERVYYNSSSGAVEFWVKIGTLSHTTDTVIYIAYGDTSISTDPNSNGTYGKTSTWNSNFKGVYHCEDASGSLTDSTSNANSIAAAGTPTYGAAGQIYNSVGTDSSNNFNGTAVATANTTHVGFLLWAKISSNNIDGCFLHNGNVTGNGDGFSLGVGSTTMDNTGNNLIGLCDNVAWMNSAAAIGTGWHHVGMTRGASTWTFYIDGAAAGSTFTNNPNTPTSNLIVGADAQGAPRNFTGDLDEMQIFDTTEPSSSWITSTYNNQNSPSTFYTISKTIFEDIGRDFYLYRKQGFQ